MVAVSSSNVIEQTERPRENFRAGREFSAARKPGGTRPRPPAERPADALATHRGPTPAHLALATFDRFDGRTWSEAAATGRRLVLNHKSTTDPWFQIDQLQPPFLRDVTRHTVRVGRLDTGVLPLPPLARAFRVGQVYQADMFAWSAEPRVTMAGRTVPTGTTIEVDAAGVDLGELRSTAIATRPREPARDAGVAALAARWGAGHAEGWAQVEAVVDALRAHAVHDRSAVADPEADDVVADFLLRSRRGPDYLFASSAVVLLRDLGYSSRLVSGLHVPQGRLDRRSGQTLLGADDLHVWAEVRMVDGTWVPIEPTPGYALAIGWRPWHAALADACVVALGWAAARWPWFAVAGLALVIGVGLRRTWIDWAATLRWRLDRRSPARRRVCRALALIEARSRWAGVPRPGHVSPRRWLERLMESPELGSSVNVEPARWLPAVDWSVHGPPGARPGEAAALAACEQMMRGWTRGRLRRAAGAILDDGGER
jgi:transglutaminase-like putative cysteine protease